MRRQRPPPQPMPHRLPRRAGAEPGIAPVAAQQRLEPDQPDAAQHQHAAQQIGRRPVIDALELVDDRGGERVVAHQHEQPVFAEQMQPDQQRPAAHRQPQLRQHHAQEDRRAGPCPAPPRRPRAPDRAGAAAPPPADRRTADRRSARSPPRPAARAAAAERCSRHSSGRTPGSPAAPPAAPPTSARPAARVRSVIQASATPSTGDQRQRDRLEPERIERGCSPTRGRNTSRTTLGPSRSIATATMKPSGMRLSSDTSTAATITTARCGSRDGRTIGVEIAASPLKRGTFRAFGRPHSIGNTPPEVSPAGQMSSDQAGRRSSARSTFWLSSCDGSTAGASSVVERRQRRVRRRRPRRRRIRTSCRPQHGLAAPARRST